MAGEAGSSYVRAVGNLTGSITFRRLESGRFGTRRFKTVLDVGNGGVLAVRFVECGGFEKSARKYQHTLGFHGAPYEKKPKKCVIIMTCRDKQRTIY